MLLKHLKKSEYTPAIMVYMAQARSGDDVVSILKSSTESFLPFLQALPEERMSYAYAPHKWTVAEVIQHITDEEKMMAYRAEQFAKGDKTNLWRYAEFFTPGHEIRKKSKAALLEDFLRARQRTTELFSDMDPAALQRMGSLSGNRVSVRGIGLVIAGHEMHHYKVLRNRYLNH